MKRFFNSRETIVTEGLDGAILSAGTGRLGRLDGYPHVKVVLRRDWSRDRVAVLSGGGSGHEPAHVGFIGRGMLTAAVAGDIFASPSVDAVLAGILAVAGPAGCLVVVKNYMGDRLNFGLAAERAKSLGIKVETVIVADDIALPDAPHPRGIAGTLFVHKIAGYLAEAGRPLDEVAAAARSTAEAIRSIGVSLSECVVPGQRPERRLADDEMELGLGIHGEPGVEKLELRAVRSIVELMAERLTAALPDDGTRYAMLVNNLGGVPPLEMSVIVHELMRSEAANRVDWLFGPAPLMTSLDMNGFSVSMLAVDDARREALLAPVEVPAWPVGVPVGEIETLPVPVEIEPFPFEPSEDARIRALLESVAQLIVGMETELNALDAKVGDGDTGTTAATAARNVLNHLDRLPLASPGALCRALGDLLSRFMGGTSGVLLSIFFTAAGDELAATDDWTGALTRGVERMRFHGGAGEGDRTMLDALIPAVEELRRGGSLSAAALAARQGAAATARMTRVRSGRSAYVPALHLTGVPDPGAVLAAAVFERLAELR